MSAAGSRLIVIAAEQEFSEVINLPWEINMGIAYIATTDEVSNGSKLELWMQSKKDPNVWLPFLNPTENENATINLVSDKIIPCSPYTDGRGAKAVKFKINQVQSNRVTLEIGMVKLLSN